MYNTQLADHRAAGPELIDFTKGVLARLSDWVADIAAHRDAARTASAIKAAAQRLAAGQPALPLVTAPAPLSEADALSAFGFSLPPDLPTAEALELPAVKPVASAPEVAFELDLSALDGVAAAAPAVAAPSAAAIDFDLQALNEPFDPQATQPLPLSEMPASAAAPVDLAFDLIDLDLGGEAANQPLAEKIEPSAAQPSEAPADLPLEIGETTSAVAEDENVKIVGTLRIGIPLFNIYLNEADELSRRLTTEVAEWAMELHRPIGETPIALAHSLAGSSATVGFNDLSHLARLLEHAQMRSQSIGYGTPEEARLFVDAAEEVRRLLHQFAAGFLKEPAPELLARLAEHEIESARRLEAATAAADLPPATGMGELDEAPELERIDLSESPEVQPEAERPTATVPSSHAPFFETSGLSVSSFGALDARVDALGVAELKPLAELPTAAGRTAERELAIEGTEVRVRAALLDRLVNHAGEVSITRARIDCRRA
jgi:chemosensory pili system protein ChpA (sensor histidine kinase/response regulator)